MYMKVRWNEIMEEAMDKLYLKTRQIIEAPLGILSEETLEAIDRELSLPDGLGFEQRGQIEYILQIVKAELRKRKR